MSSAQTSSALSNRDSSPAKTTSPSSEPLSQAEADAIIERSAKVARENARRAADRRLPAPIVHPRAQMLVTEAQLKAAEEAESQRKSRETIQKLEQASRVPKRYRSATLAVRDSPSIPEIARRSYGAAVDAASRLLDSPGIIALIGPRGVGKTWIACALVNEFCRRGRSARYLHVMDYFIGLKATYGDHAKTTEGSYESDHLRPELLVLDEVHERADTAWEDRMLTRLIVKRHDLELATILLSNDDEQKFTRRVGDSIVNRMHQDAGGIVVCDWRCLRDFKREIVKQ